MPTRPSVILLHGIWMRAGVTARLAGRLSAAGFSVSRFDYASLRSPQHEHHQRLDALIASFDGTVHLVGHSLGGVVAVDYLQRGSAHAARVGRVVCLGSPLLGSTLARRLQRVRLDTLGLGHAREVLVDGLAPWSGPQQVGVIAGEVSFGLSLLLGRLPRPNDGTVAVAETRLPGISDHATVRASHTALLFSERAAALTVRFLRNGRFA
ncbi:MAG: alpha/beta fold hydrolase [Rhodanobacteraceae bacterium]|nr:alpha/beta fold hydrolase [Rhodanobacteraceae bacterium]